MPNRFLAKKFRFLHVFLYIKDIERKKQVNRQKDRQKEGKIDRNNDIKIDIEKERKICRMIDRKKYKQKHKKIDRKIDLQKDRLIERQIDKKIDIHRLTER